MELDSNSLAHHHHIHSSSAWSTSLRGTMFQSRRVLELRSDPMTYIIYFVLPLREMCERCPQTKQITWQNRFTASQDSTILGYVNVIDLILMKRILMQRKKPMAFSQSVTPGSDCNLSLPPATNYHTTLLMYPCCGRASTYRPSHSSQPPTVRTLEPGSAVLLFPLLSME